MLLCHRTWVFIRLAVLVLLFVTLNPSKSCFLCDLCQVMPDCNPSPPQYSGHSFCIQASQFSNLPLTVGLLVIHIFYVHAQSSFTIRGPSNPQRPACRCRLIPAHNIHNICSTSCLLRPHCLLADQKFNVVSSSPKFFFNFHHKCFLSLSLKLCFVDCGGCLFLLLHIENEDLKANVSLWDTQLCFFYSC